MKLDRAFSAALAVMLAASAARADVPPENAALAEELFVRGKEAMQKGDIDRACSMLAESQALDPGGGTLLALALCHEAQGKTASAWAELQETLTLALRQGQEERAAVARERLAAIEPRLSKMTILLSQTMVGLPGLEIRRDGELIPRAAWGLPIPIDPGVREIVVSAPDHLPFKKSVHVQPERSDQEVVIPDLVRAPQPAPSPAESARPATTAPSPPAAPEADGDQSRIWFAVSGAAGGLAALAFVSAVGSSIRAGDLQESADRACPTAACSNRDAISDAEEAGRWADAATGLVVVGSVSAALSVATLVVPFAMPDPPKHGAARAELRVGPSSIGAFFAW